MGIKNVTINDVTYKIDCPDEDSEKFDILTRNIIEKVKKLSYSIGGNLQRNDLLLLLLAINQQDEIINHESSFMLLSNKISILKDKIDIVMEEALMKDA